MLEKILKLFRKNTKRVDDENQQDTCLKELKKYVGKLIEVHYINQDIPREEIAILKHPQQTILYA